MPGFLNPGKGVPLLLIPECSGISKGQRVPDRPKTAHRKPLVKCFLTVFLAAALSLQLWTFTLQAPPSMGFSRQKYWSGLLYPPPGDLPDPGTELGSPASQANSLSLNYQGSPLFSSSKL